MDTQVRLYTPITKTDKTQHMVYGYASTEALDSQGEIVKASAMKAAIADYMKFANVREMHQPKAVGKTKHITHDDKGTYIGVKVVDKDAWEKIEEGVYNGFSIGGRVNQKVDNYITSLALSEISLVDRPANPEAVFDVWKMDIGIEKKNFSTDERKALAASGKAMPDGSFPIVSAKDVVNAVHDWGRAGAKPSVKAHIIRRAKTLGVTDKLPSDWPSSTQSSEKIHKDIVGMVEKNTKDENTDTTMQEDNNNNLTISSDNKSMDAIRQIVDEKIQKGEMPTETEIDELLKSQDIESTEKTQKLMKFEVAGLIVKAVGAQMEKTANVDALKLQAKLILDAADVNSAYTVEEKNQFKKVLDLIKAAEENIHNVADVKMPQEAPNSNMTTNGNSAQSSDLVSLQDVVEMLNSKGLGGALTQDEIDALRQGVSAGSERTSAQQMTDEATRASADDQEYVYDKGMVVNMKDEITNLKKVQAQEKSELLEKIDGLTKTVTELSKTAQAIKVKTNYSIVEKAEKSEDKNMELQKAEDRATQLQSLMKSDPTNTGYHQEAKELAPYIMKLRRETHGQK